MASARIRKQANDLTAADFVVHPVWEFAIDEETVEGQDETTVRPYLFDGALDPSDAGFVVAARLVLADGTSFDGFLTPPPVPGELDLGHIQPCILAPAGHVSFWYGLCPLTAKDIAESYARLGKTAASEVFPIRFEATVSLKGGTVKGVVPGFLAYEDWKTERIRVSK